MRRWVALGGALLGAVLGPCADHSRAAGQTQAPADTVLLQGLGRPLTLDDCLGIAVERNLLLAIARHERDAVQTGVGGALGAWLPVFTVAAVRSGSRTDREDSAAAGPRHFSEATATDVVARMTQRLPLGGSFALAYNFDQAGEDILGGYGGSVSVVQPLLRGAGWNRAVADVRDARLAAGSQQATLESQLLLVRFRVKAAYYEVVRRRRLIEVSERAIARDEQLRAFSQAKVEAKLATRRDVLSAEIVLAQDRDRLVRAETEYRAALDELADVLGVPFGQSLDVQIVDLQHAPIALDAERWVEKARRDNPEIRRARLDLDRDELAQRVAGNARLPQLDVGLAYAEVRDPIAAGDVASVRRRETTWLGSVEVSYPLLNKPLGNAYRAARIRYEQSRIRRDETERRIILLVRESVRNLQRSQERLAVLEKTIQGARDKVEFANVSFQLGRASNLDITDAQKDLVDAETDHVDELVNHEVELARLESLLGGMLE